MAKPVKINLDDLTAEMVREALPNVGQCSYAAPCIIGVLVPPGDRERLDRAGVEMDSPALGFLLEQGIVTLPKKQVAEAKDIQEAFDNYGPEGFLEQPRIAKLLGQQVSA